MTALADLLGPADRDCLAAHMRELAGLARLVAERGANAEHPPAPLAELAERDRGGAVSASRTRLRCRFTSLLAREIAAIDR